MLTYERFYKLFGIRRISDLVTPTINRLEDISLPRESIYHFLPEDSGTMGISSDHWAIKDSERLVQVVHVTELPTPLRVGNSRQSSVIPITLIKEYHSRHRKLKRSVDLKRSIRDPKTPLVVNYALIPRLYIYTKSMYSSYHKKDNLVQALWENVDMYSSLTDRDSYVTVELPDLIPSLTMLRKAEEEIPNALLESFNGIGELLILDLWRWLGEFRETSLLSKLSPKSIDRTNVIVKRHNRWFMFNLGLIDDWRDGVINDGDIGPKALQKRFLKLLITLFESTTVTLDTNVTVKEVDVTVVETASEKLEDTFEPVDTSAVKKVLKKTDQDDDLETELDTLATIAEEIKVENEKDVFIVTEPTIEDSILAKADELAQSGEISVAEFKRYQVLATAHQDIKNPYTGKGSIVDAIKIDPKELELSKPEQFTDKVAVLDKSMLNSSIGTFNKDYVEKILPKDIVGSVMALSNAGVPITDYEVEEVEDITGHYEIHTVRATPLGGKRSTLTFKLPKITPEGTYKYNNVTYKMRMQRIDVPIRKTNSSTVALTSYYGKVFIKRSEKAVHDYGRWLIKNIKLIDTDKSDSRVTNIVSATKFDISITLPKIYSTLGQVFESFKSNDFEFFFDYPNRASHFKIEKLSSVEKRGSVLVGRTKGKLLVMDDNNMLYSVTDSKLTEVGTLEDILELDKVKAPVETAEIKVFAASLPLGFVLAYYIGIDRLINSLKSEVKRIPSGERLQMSGEEYAIRFEDETLIVNRGDRLASLILSGFNNYKKSIKSFSIHDFNKKDIYFNVLSDYGLGIRQLRELDLMKDMFVDPITLEILKELKQPTVWLPILRYAAELLLTDQSLSETDLSEMRIRGYERVAGTVYNELVQTMRGYKSRGGIGNVALDLNPYAVWKAITDDPAITQSEESNPIKNINEKEAITYMGAGGRSRESMVGRTRIYNPSDMGTISEATVDSGDVAINTYTSANPKLTNLRGLTDRYDKSTDGPANILSTAAMLSPGAANDD